jgi:hypothetical protein
VPVGHALPVVADGIGSVGAAAGRNCRHQRADDRQDRHAPGRRLTVITENEWEARVLHEPQLTEIAILRQ